MFAIIFTIMNIGIDTFGCGHGKTGLGSYLSSLSAQLKNTDKNKFELFGSEIDRYTYGSETGLNFFSVKLPDSERAEIFWHYAFANFFAKRRHYSAVLYTAGARYLPFFYSIPGVAVVHDVVSELYLSGGSERRKARVIFSLKNASKIIAVSHFIRRDLIKLGVKDEKIVVVYNGINHSEFYPREDLEPELMDIKPFSVKKPYFIYPSQMSAATKKHVELIRAFNLFKERTHLGHRLVLTGKEGNVTQDVKNEILKSKFREDIFIVGFFPHESFPLLYSNSEGCLFPSINEGVGLPVLEALATGIPVACSNAGSLPEIAGDNALYFNSDDIEEMAKAIELLAVDSALRKKLKASGIEWTKRFSWDKTAEKTIEVLKSVAK